MMLSNDKNKALPLTLVKTSSGWEKGIQFHECQSVMDDQLVSGMFDRLLKKKMFHSVQHSFDQFIFLSPEFDFSSQRG
jgi:hypothetical protein